MSSESAYQLTKARISEHQRLMKTDAAKSYIAKKQKGRGGVGDGLYRVQGRTADGREPGTVAKANGQIRTIQDMIDYHYGFVPEYYAQKNDKGGMGKADDTVVGGGGGLTPTRGYRNAVFGSEVFSNINHEVNAFALLETRPWTKSGERTIVDFGHELGSGGIGENAEVPDTDAPEIRQYQQDAKTVSHTFDVSQVKQLLADTEDDDLEDPFDFLRRYYGEGTEQTNGLGEHPKHINVQMLQSVDEISTTDSQNMLSIDQIISNSQESSIGSVTQGANDIYGFDRSAGEFESNVVHNDGDTRTFTIDLLDDAIRQVKNSTGMNPVADDNYFFLTNHDTYQRIEEEVGGKERLEAVRTSVGLNGVDTNPGDDVGITVQSYKQIPIFESVDVPQDPGGIGRVYLVDSATLFQKVLLPTQFYSSGTEVNDDPYAINQLGNKGMYVTIGEVTTTAPGRHCKVRDLQ